MTASASRPPNFTFPSLPVRHRVLISRRTPARASRPDNLTFSTPRPTYLSVFTCPTQRASTSRRTPARASRPDNFTFSNLLRNEAYPSDTATSKPVGRRRELHSQTILPSMSHARRGLPVRLGDYQANVGESLPARQLIFSVSSHHHSNPAERCTLDRSNNLSFQSTTGEVPPSDPRVSISRRKS